ncbi:beta strand repeat-containing protein [Paenibacillus foliorum]|uniref:beta strand repeat-containing protein n=1 Tax=Paenibacillus foliorum TaxID=2654974 RepID=UPI0014913463|nr:cadherin-like beta sandwich domain-containing protein [Paenibacillus foliorum]
MEVVSRPSNVSALLRPIFFRWFGLFFGVLALTLLLAIFVPLQASAATFTVNTTNDTSDISPGIGGCSDSGGLCSLRAAIEESNALPGSDLIQVPVGVYTLTLGQLEIKGDVSIVGASGDVNGNPAQTIIQAAATPNTASNRVFEVNPSLANGGFQVSFKSLTIRNGKAPDLNGYGGGGIAGDTGTNTITIANSIIEQNFASNHGYGGGLYLSGLLGGSVVMDHVIIRNNSAGSNTPPYSSRGGGVYAEGDINLQFSHVTIENNTSFGFGGGLAIISQSLNPRQITISDSTISSNVARSVTRGADTEGRGAGIYLNAPATLTNTGISGNNADGDGGGLVLDYYNGTVALNSVTIAGNGNYGRGGGLYINGYAPPVLTSTTITSNINLSNSSASEVGSNPDYPDLKVTASHTSSFTQGQSGAIYSLTVQNVGAVGGSGTVTVTDTLPAGLTATAMGGNGWSCTLSSLTCTRTGSFAAGQIYPAIELTVNVAADAAASVTNTVVVAGEGVGELNTFNNSAADVTTISQNPNLSVHMSHTGDFRQGQTGAAYTIAVANSGMGPTNGTVTVSGTLPEGLKATAISGTGWTCDLMTLTCTRSDALAPGQSYPAITLTMSVSSIAEASLTSGATVTGGGDVSSENNTSSDPTLINHRSELIGLTLSAGSLNQPIAWGTFDYSAIVGNEVNSLTVTPTAYESSFTLGISMDGGTTYVPILSGASSNSLSLNVGPNIISVKVTAPDATTEQIYTLTVTRERSSNAGLSGLSLSEGTLNPAFATGTVSYSSSVDNAVSSLIVKPIVSDSTGTIAVQVNSGGFMPVVSGEASGPLILSVGVNTVEVKVTAQDGTTTQSYTVTITRLSNNANLSELSLSSGTLSPGFTEGTVSYSASVGNAVSSLTLTPRVLDSAAKVEVQVNGGGFTLVTSGEASGPLSLNVGVNTIEVKVTAQDGTVKSYSIAVTRLNNNANLSGLSLSEGTLSPEFAVGTASYSAVVGNSVSSITLMTTADPTASIEVSINNAVYTPYTNGALSLVVGSNTIEVKVIAQDGTTKSYSIAVTRLSNNANLSELGLSNGTLSPWFAEGTVNYIASVGNAVSSLTVTPKVSDSAATVEVQVNGGGFTLVTSGEASGSLGLNVGVNTIEVKVTAQDGTVKSYSIVVTRLNNNANLGGLSLSEGELSPKFAEGTASYSAVVGNAVSSITLMTTADPTASIEVSVNNAVYSPYANGAAGGSLNLNVGVNTIDVKVTAQDNNTVKSYSIAITRSFNNDANLSGLNLSEGTLSPVFAEGTVSYSASVGNAVSSLTVTPKMSEDSAATVAVQVNGGGFTPVTSGEASGSLSLNVGMNTIDVKVTAQDNSTVKSYSIAVTRLNNNANLSGLSLSEGELSPKFAEGTASYSAVVGNAVSSITLMTTADPTASIEVSVNNAVYSPYANGTEGGSLNLNVGVNTIEVKVTAQDKTHRSYSIKITRLSNNSSLGDLRLSSSDNNSSFISLSPSFISTQANYQASVADSVYQVYVYATPKDAYSSITVSGATYSASASGGIPVRLSSDSATLITIEVTAQDRSKTETYTIKVLRATMQIEALRRELAALDSQQDGIGINEIMQWINNSKHDLTGDGKFDSKDVMLLLLQIDPMRH